MAENYTLLVSFGRYYSLDMHLFLEKQAALNNEQFLDNRDHDGVALFSDRRHRVDMPTNRNSFNFCRPVSEQLVNQLLSLVSDPSYLDTAHFDDLLRHRDLFGEKREDGFAGFGGNPVGVGPRSHSCSQPMSNAHADAGPAAPLAPTERKPSCLPGLPVRQRSLEGQ